MEAVKTLSDTELVANLRSGSKMEESVKAIYRSYFDSLSWYVMNNSGSRQDAEDIFQEVIISFIELVQKGKFRGESSIKTFLFSLNRHVWLNELKRRGRAMAREEKFEKNQAIIQLDVSHTVEDREAKAQMMQLVSALGETCRKILTMFYYENMPVKAMLEFLDYENEQVIRNRKYKCLKQLEQMITQNPSLKQQLKKLVHE